MLELGFIDIYRIYTGIIEWLNKGLPIIKQNQPRPFKMVKS